MLAVHPQGYLMEEANRRTAKLYNAAADHYDDDALSFWNRFGSATIERLNLAPGERVLDVCSGTGASAIPAARAVGPTGRVLAVDLADKLVALGRTKATELGLTNLEFRPGDFEQMELSNGSFDVGVCVFGVSFLPDKVRGLKALWHGVKPGGRIAVTMWGPRLFERMNGVFWDAVRVERPELYKAFNPWDDMTEPAQLLELFHKAGIAGAEAVAEAGTHAVGTAEDWWKIVMGSGYRGTIDQLTAEQRQRVRVACDEYHHHYGVREVEANVIYAVAKRPVG